MKKWLIVSFVIAALFFTASPISATGGTPATQVCDSGTALSAIPPIYPAPPADGSGGFSNPDIVESAQGFQVDRNGNMYVALRWEKAGPILQGAIYKINNNCQVVWRYTSRDFGCLNTAVSCYPAIPPTPDAAGRIFTAFQYNDGTNIRWNWTLINAATGALVRKSEDITIALGDGYTVNHADSMRLSSTSVGYLVASNSGNFIERWNETLVRDYRVVHAGAGNIYADAEIGIAYVHRTGYSWARVNQTNGSIINTGGSAAQLTAFSNIRPGSDTNAYYVGTETNGSLSQFYYKRLTKATLAETNVVVTPNRILPDTGFGTAARWHSLDSANNFLVCGNHAPTMVGTQNQHMIGQILTSNNTLHWNLTYQRAVGVPSSIACEFDFASGFYVLGAQPQYNNYVRRYTGGGFGQPTPPAAVDVPGDGLGADAPGSEGSTNFVDFTRDFCSEKWGFDCSWLLGIGVISIVITGFARVGTSPLLIGFGALLGVGLGVALDLLPLWLLLTVVFLIIALAGRNLFDDED